MIFRVLGKINALFNLLKFMQNSAFLGKINVLPIMNNETYSNEQYNIIGFKAQFKIQTKLTL